MDNDQPVPPRRRLQTLLAIPDSQRTEADWDEIVELEIQLAPGNREGGPGRDMRMAPAQTIRKPSKPVASKPVISSNPSNKPVKKPRTKLRRPKATPSPEE